MNAPVVPALFRAQWQPVPFATVMLSASVLGATMGAAERAAPMPPWFVIPLVGTPAVLGATLVGDLSSPMARVLPVTPEQRCRASLLEACRMIVLPALVAAAVAWALSSAPMDTSALRAAPLTLVAVGLAAVLHVLLSDRRRASRAWALAPPAVGGAAVAVGWAAPISAAVAFGGLTAVAAGWAWLRGTVRGAGATTASPRIAGHARVVATMTHLVLYTAFLGWLARGDFTTQSWIWLPFVALVVGGACALLLQPVRVMGHLPLPRDRLARRAALVPLAGLAVAVVLAALIPTWSSGWSHRAARVELERDDARDRYRAVVRAPLHLHEWSWGSPGARRDAAGREFVPRASRSRLGFVLVDPYQLADGATFEETVDAAERLLAAMSDDPPSRDRIEQRLLQRGADDLPERRSADRDTGEPIAGSRLDEVFPELGARRTIAPLSAFAALLLLAWVCGVGVATRPRPPRSIHGRKAYYLALGVGFLGFLVGMVAFGEHVAVLVHRLDRFAQSPWGLGLGAAVLVTTVVWAQRRVRVMEAVPLPMDRR